MLHLQFKQLEKYTEEEGFTYFGGGEVDLEHSLYTIALWESKWKKPWLTKERKSFQEYMSYIECMCITPDVDKEMFLLLTEDQQQQITDYIYDPQTATKIYRFNNQKPNRRQIITNELIYYWMFSLGIPMECEHWHFNRLMTMIELSSVKNGGSQKMKSRDIQQMYAQLNADRRAKLGSKG